MLRDDGTLWLNLGDSYAGASAPGKWREGSARADGEVRADGNSRRNRNGTGAVRGVKSKELIGIPWRVAFALQDDGWYLRQDIIWHKPNPMPESVRDRCTKAHEYIFLLSKRPKYYFDGAAIKERAVGGCSDRGASFKRDPGGKRSVVHPGQNNATHRPDRPDVSYNGKTRNRRSVWSVPTRAFKGAHFATFPPELIEPCVLAGCPVGGVVLDPFGGAGTTGLVAQRHGRNAILCELNHEYAEMARNRVDADLLPAKPKRAARAGRPARPDVAEAR